MSAIKSPFHQNHLIKETALAIDSEETTFFIKCWNYFLKRGNEAFLQLIPSNDIRDMPSSFLYPIGCFFFIIILGLFLVIFILSYQNQIDTKFLSPLPSDTSTNPSPYCQTITVANSATLRATQSGYWEGASEFQYSEASYIATVTNWQVTPTEYADALNVLYLSILAVGNISQQNDLGYNLMYWFSYTARPEADNTAQRFFLIGDPIVVFNRQYLQGTVSSVLGDCNVTSNAAFEKAKGVLTMGYSYESFIENQICNATGDPTVLGYLPNINSDLYQIKFDVRSLITALAVNLKVAFLSDLVEITAFRETYTYQGQIFNISSYYDPKYPGMKPITCLTDPMLSQCVLLIGQSYALPTFNHFGNNTEYPMKCICSDYARNTTLLNDRYYACNIFQLLAGIIYYPTNTPDAIIELMMKMNFSAKLVNEYVYTPSFIASYWGKTSSYYENQFIDPTYRQSIYEFCKISIGYCSIVTFSLFDETYDWSISSYYFQLLTGACQDKISTPYSSWKRLIDEPFLPLIQDYQKCHYTPTAVFVNELGVTMGTISAITPFLIIAFIQILICFQLCSGKRIPVIYRKFERDTALNAFAMSLLLTRDRKFFRGVAGGAGGGGGGGGGGGEQEGNHADVLHDIVEVLERDAILFNDAYKLQSEMNEMTTQWKEIKNQQLQQINPLTSPLLYQTAKTNKEKPATGTIRVLNAGRYFPQSSSSLSHNYEDYHQVLSWLQELLRQIEEIIHSDQTKSSSPSDAGRRANASLDGKIWFLLNETVCFQKLPDNLFGDDKTHQEELIKVIIKILCYHISVITGIDSDRYQPRSHELFEQIQLLYKQQYGYYLGKQMYSLAEMLQLCEDHRIVIQEND